MIVEDGVPEGNGDMSVALNEEDNRVKEIVEKSNQVQSSHCYPRKEIEHPTKFNLCSLRVNVISKSEVDRVLQYIMSDTIPNIMHILCFAALISEQIFDIKISKQNKQDGTQLETGYINRTFFRGYILLRLGSRLK